MADTPLRDDPDLEALITKARLALSSPLRWAAAAPGRVNLIGDHTDYSEGFALPIAIDRHVVAIAAPASTGGRGTVRSTAYPGVVEVDATASVRPEPGHWANPVLGVIREFAAAGYALQGLDIALASDVPVGAGLSSSAAVEVATATLLESVLGISLDAVAKAVLCRRAEESFVGTPCGIMDMLISAAAQPGAALLIDCRTLATEPVPVPDGATVLVVHSGVSRALATSAYADRRATCERVAAKLGVESLRDVTPAMLETAALDELERRRARHVVDENDRTTAAAAAMRAGRLDDLGRLIIESHESLRDLYEVSCDELDAIVTAACEQPGVLGARMTGAGFGGCAVVLCRAGVEVSIPGAFAVRAVGAARPLIVAS